LSGLPASSNAGTGSVISVCGIQKPAKIHAFFHIPFLIVSIMQAVPPKNKVYMGNNFAGMKALVMGLGLHGGGLESARYLAGKGAIVTVTDLRDEKTLEPTIEKLKGFPIR
jgi:hypothetical protein